MEVRRKDKKKGFRVFFKLRIYFFFGQKIEDILIFFVLNVSVDGN